MNEPIHLAGGGEIPAAPVFMTRDASGGGPAPRSPASVVPPETGSADPRVRALVAELNREAAPLIAAEIERVFMARAEESDARFARIEALLERAGVGSPNPYRGAAHGAPTPAERPVFTRSRDGQPLVSGCRKAEASAAQPREELGELDRRLRTRSVLLGGEPGRPGVHVVDALAERA